jgi:parallel beta-helix repeat protein
VPNCNWYEKSSISNIRITNVTVANCWVSNVYVCAPEVYFNGNITGTDSYPYYGIIVSNYLYWADDNNWYFMDYASNVTIEYATVEHCYVGGIFVYDASGYITVENCTCRYNTFGGDTTSGFGIFFSYSSGNNKAINNRVYGNNYGISAGNENYDEFVNNVVESNYVEGISARNVDYINISNNILRFNGNYGISSAISVYSENYNAGHVDVVNNTLYANYRGIVIQGYTIGSVLKNNVTLCTMEGIVLDSGINTGGSNQIVEENEIRGCRRGIWVINSSYDNIIRNNVIHDNERGIVVQSGYNNSIRQNVIYNNSYLGIDLGEDGVTPNDGQIVTSQPNHGMDYPVITTVSLNGNTLHVEGYIGVEGVGGSSNFANAIVDVYLVKNSTGGDNLVGNDYNGKYYGEGWVYLGSLIADSNGYFSGDIDVSGKGVDTNSYISATATLSGRGTSEFGPNYLLSQAVVVEGYVYEDFKTLGIKDNDVGIPNVQVALFKDNTTAGTQGILDSNDELVATTVTNSTGYYNFTITDTSALYFVAVNSSTVNTTRGLNSGYTINDIWAEQTYQTNESNYSQIIQLFGGRNPKISDNWSAGVYEHYVKINCSEYDNEPIIFGFSFDVVVNTNDLSENSQGSFRQFIQNANAIRGANRMYFIPTVPQNNPDGWEIYINYTSLGLLPVVKDDYTEINGTVFNTDLTINESAELIINGTSIPAGVWAGSPNYVIKVNANHSNVTYLHITNASNDYVAGIYLYQSAYCNITNVEVDNNFYGIHLSQSSNNTLSNITAVENTNIGIYLYYNNNNNILTDILANNNYDGIYLYQSNNNYLKNITANGNSHYGIYIYTSNGNTLTDISTNYNRKGLYIMWDSDYNVLSNITASNNDEYGIEILLNCDHNSLTNVTANNNGHIGVEIYWWSNYNSLVNITTNNNTDTGIYVSQSENNIFTNIIANNNGYGGIELRDSSNNNIFTNVVAYCNGKGVVVELGYNNTFSYLSIYNNTYLGIDLGDDNVTLNDGQLNSSQPNYGVDYPVITYAEFNGTHLYVEGFINDESAETGSSNFENAIVDVYLVKNSTGGDNLIGNNISSDGLTLNKYYGEGWIYLGSLTANSNGEFEGWLEVAGKGVEWYALITATATLNGNTSEFGPNYLLVRKISVSTGITVFWQNDHYNATITVTALNETQHKITVYWIKPENLTINSMQGDYDYNNSYNNIYYWKFDVIKAGETKYVYLNLSASNECSLSEAYVIGIDPNRGGLSEN